MLTRTHLVLCSSLMLSLSSFTQAQNFGVIDEKPKEVAETPVATTEPVAAAAVATPDTAPVQAQAPLGSGVPIASLSNTVEDPAASDTTKAYAGQPENSKYTLGPNDVIEIIVARHPEVSGKYAINNEGKIQYEFVGDIVLMGMAKEEASKVVAKQLTTYIVNPEVTLKIVEYNSKVVYVVGEVGLPGKIYMRGDIITVRDALLAAGLPQLTASTEQATLFTPAEDGKVVEKKVNVYALLYKGDLRENYTMRPGDTLYLPATLWAKVARFINPVAQPVGAAAGAGRMVTTGGI